METARRYIGSDSDATKHIAMLTVLPIPDCHEVYERHIVTVRPVRRINKDNVGRLPRKFNGVIWSEEEKIDMTILICGVVECPVHLVITKLHN